MMELLAGMGVDMTWQRVGRTQPGSRRQPSRCFSSPSPSPKSPHGHHHPLDQAWLNEHKKNPYPTKGEKIMLAIITKMTLTQVEEDK